MHRTQDQTPALPCANGACLSEEQKLALRQQTLSHFTRPTSPRGEWESILVGACKRSDAAHGCWITGAPSVLVGSTSEKRAVALVEQRAESFERKLHGSGAACTHTAVCQKTTEPVSKPSQSLRSSA